MASCPATPSAAPRNSVSWRFAPTATLYVAAFISAPVQRGKAIGYVTKRPASADPFIIGLEFIGRLLVMLVIITGGIAFWPLVWLPLLVGMWRLRKERKA